MSGLATDNGQPPRRGAPPRAVIGVVADEETRDALVAAASQRDIPFAFEIGGIDMALAGLHPDETADCVIVDLDGAPDAVDDIAVLVTGLPHYAELIVLGIFTPDQSLELMQAGAHLCLPKPLSESALNRILGGIPAAAPRRPVPEPVIASPPQRQQATYYPPQPAPAPEPAPEPAIARRAPERQPPPEPRYEPMPAPFTPPPAREAPVSEAYVQVPPAASPPVAFNPAEAPPSYGAPPPRPEATKSRVITVIGCRGGVGASTVAVGLAWLLAEDMEHSTALLDLDPFFGSIALALNLDPGDALQQALERPSRIDSVFLNRAVRKVGEHLYVLCSEQSLDRPTKRDPSGPAALIRSLTSRYERVVVDLPRAAPETMTPVFALSDEILLVTDLSLAGARDATRLMVLVRNATSYARVRIVGGGARDAGKSPILSPSEFRRAVGTAVEITIAHDGETASDAARSGRALPKVFPRSPASKALRNLAQSLGSGNQREQKRRLLWWKR